MTSKILSICIPVFNKWNFTKTCLNDLSKLPSNHEIIIVDNGSTDETQNNLQNSSEVIYYRKDKNYGFANASNEAYGLSSAPNVLFLNNDIRIKSDHSSWTLSLIAKCDEGLVGPTMGQLDNQLNFVQEANKALTGNSYLSGWCLASSKKIFKKLDISGDNQIFSEEFFCYFEDTDLSFRARQLQIPMILTDVPVVHFGKTSSRQLNTQVLYTKSRNIFVKKWGKLIKA